MGLCPLHAHLSTLPTLVCTNPHCISLIISDKVALKNDIKMASVTWYSGEAKLTNVASRGHNHI